MSQFVSPVELTRHFAATGSTLFPDLNDAGSERILRPLLEGVRVLDLTVFEAGPSGAQALAQRGANVVKIERPGIGDPARSMFGPGRDSPYFVIYNLNKRSVTIDLKSPEGRALFLQMVPHFDVVIENYGPGAMEGLGLGYEDLKAVHNDIIYASLKGFGSTGPYARFNCFDMIAQAAVGAYSVTGYKDGPPMRSVPTTADSGTGTMMYGDICAALYNRQRGGGGRFLDVSMQESMITNAMKTLAAMTGFGEHDIGRIGNGHDNNPFIDMYECGGETGDLNNYIGAVLVN